MKKKSSSGRSNELESSFFSFLAQVEKKEEIEFVFHIFRMGGCISMYCQTVGDEEPLKKFEACLAESSDSHISLSSVTVISSLDIKRNDAEVISEAIGNLRKSPSKSSLRKKSNVGEENGKADAQNCQTSFQISNSDSASEEKGMQAPDGPSIMQNSCCSTESNNSQKSLSRSVSFSQRVTIISYKK